MQDWLELEMRMGNPDWTYGDSPSEEEADGMEEEEEAQFTDEDEEDCDDKEGEGQKARPSSPLLTLLH